MLSATLQGFTLYQLLFYFFFYSFLGWVMETVLVSTREHRFVNRGFLNGPICPIYGVGMCAIIIFLTPFQGRLTDVFLGGMIVASAIEYFTGWLMEKLFHAKWWDYSDKKFNLQGRICLQISIAWGVLSLTIIQIIQPTVAGLVDQIPVKVGAILLYVLLALLLADCVQSVWAALKLSKKLRSLGQIKQDLHALYESSGLYESGEELKRRLENSRISELFAELSGNKEANQTRKNRIEQLRRKYTLHLGKRSFSQRRLLKAFPTMHTPNLGKVLEELRESLKKNHKNK
ncbi:MAG: putative ABC transporter permease [Massilioclostridium sp.]|nr:putative ABC transporter permease [Massilioclostridium sp.]